jgi:hypothetical protein
MKQDDWVPMREAWKFGFVGKTPKWHRRNLSPWLPLWQGTFRLKILIDLSAHGISPK